MSDNLDTEKLAKELKLTDKQKLFAEYFIYVTGLDGPAAVELAGYSSGSDHKDYGKESTNNFFRSLKFRQLARNLLSNRKVLDYINALRKDLDSQLIIDKLWVINKLKTLAETGSENTQLKATELLGKTLELFTEKTKFESSENPADIAKQAFERRKQNVVEFNKKQQNE